MLKGLVVGLLLGAAAGWFLREWTYRRWLKRRAKMLSFVAHELNTPLTAVNMTVLNFLSGIFGPLAKEHTDWMLILKEQTQRLNGLVGELRDLVHLEFHQDLRLRTEPSDVRKLLAAAVAQTEGTVTRSGARLDLSVPEDLPQAQADPDRFQRVISSVLAHARKFRREGPIAIAASASGGSVEIAFRYVANKLPPGESDKMLDLFYPVAAAAGGSQLLSSVGTGLGMCRVMMEKQGGSLGLKADSDGKTELVLRLKKA